MASTQVVLRPEVDAAGLRVQRDLSIDYLRTLLVMMVVADHCALPYTSHISVGWRYMILSDANRWACFDYLTYFIDMFCMALFFFISGLFVYPALRRHGTAGFLRDRFRRLGIPFVASVAVLLPIALYASWRLTGHFAGFAAFYTRVPVRNFPIGPPWFLWQLLFFDVLLVLALMPLKQWVLRVQRTVLALRNRPIVAFAALCFLVSLVYLPLLRRYGYSSWTDLVTWPFSFQTARVGLYAVWFLFGFWVGAPGLGKGLFARQRSLARHWPFWILACALPCNALWFVPRWINAHGLRVPHFAWIESLLWVASCTAICFALLAFFRGVNLPSCTWMRSLNRSTYVIYLVHYVFIAWLQFIVRNRPIDVRLKFLLVLLVAVSLSWLTAQMLLRIPALRTIL